MDILSNKQNPIRSLDKEHQDYDQIQSLLDKNKEIDMSEIFKDAYFSEFLENIH